MKKKPKRILTFSDGVLEEYSDDETDAGIEKEEVITVNPVSFFFLSTKLLIKLNLTLMRINK